MLQATLDPRRQGWTRGRRDRRPDFRKLLGEAAWRRLPAAVQARFSPHRDLVCTHYCGVMEVRASRLGKCLAWLCRLIGTPVAPLEGAEVPVDVDVIDCADGRGTVWERRYSFKENSPCVVRSIKQIDAGGALIEALGAGLRMQLTVFEDHGALHFLSSGYFFQLGPWRIPLPKWFPPGTTHVIHEDRGDGAFVFTMRTEHAALGEMFFQRGIFH